LCWPEAGTLQRPTESIKGWTGMVLLLAEGKTEILTSYFLCCCSYFYKQKANKTSMENVG
jgi:hypothetical protein